MDYLKAVRDLAADGRNEDEILDYIEHLEAVEECNRCHNFEGV